MSNYKVEISGVDTRNLKVLSNEEMLELFKNIKTNPFARNDLVEGNLKLVLSILKKFKNYNENLDDLFQVGCVGLVKSIDNFDLSQNVKFSTYAVPMIIGEIRRYLRDNNTIRVSRSIKDLAYKALKYKEEYILTNGKEPSCEEISQKLECTTYDVVTALASLRNQFLCLNQSIVMVEIQFIYMIKSKIKSKKAVRWKNVLLPMMLLQCFQKDVSIF